MGSSALKLEEEVAAVTETGLYESPEAFLSDAVKTLLAARPDLREAVACRLYERGTFSLERSAVWAGMSLEALKESLHRCGIARQAPEGPAEIEALAKRALAAAGRPVKGPARCCWTPISSALSSRSNSWLWCGTSTASKLL
jgi:predicted HTH domain antitoxin